MSVVVNGAFKPIHERAKKLLNQHYDALSDFDRDYLCSLYSRKIVFGTKFQAKRITGIEDIFKK